VNIRAVVATVQPRRRSSSLPLVGRVAHPEQSEGCDGWGLFPHRDISRIDMRCPHPALRATLPTRVGGKRKNELRSAAHKWEGKAKREIALAMTEQTWLCAHCRCKQRNRIGGLHPSPVFVGRVARRERSERCGGWGLSPRATYSCSGVRRQTPPGASRHPPHKSGRDKKERASLVPTLTKGRRNSSQLQRLTSIQRALVFGAVEGKRRHVDLEALAALALHLVTAGHEARCGL